MLEKHITSTYISCIIVNKLSYNQKAPSQIILLVIEKNFEINLYYTIFLFGLIISLRVKSSKKPLLDFQEIIKR